MRTVKLKLSKGGIILPKLTAQEIQDVKKRTEEKLVEGIKDRGLDAKIASDNVDLGDLLAELGADDEEGKSKTDKVLIAQNKQTQKKIKEEQQKVLTEVTAKTGVIQSDLKQIINDAVANNTSVQTALQDIGLDTKTAKAVVQKLNIISSANLAGNPRAQKLTAYDAKLQSNGVTLPFFADGRLMDVMINDKDTINNKANLENITKKELQDLIDFSAVLGKDPKEEIDIFGAPDPNTKYWKFKNEFLKDIQKIQKNITDINTKKTAKQNDLNKVRGKKNLLKISYEPKYEKIKKDRENTQIAVKNASSEWIKSIDDFLNSKDFQDSIGTFTSLARSFSRSTNPAKVLSGADQVLAVVKDISELDTDANLPIQQFIGDTSKWYAVDDAGKLKIAIQNPAGGTDYYTLSTLATKLKLIRNGIASGKLRPDVVYDPKLYDAQEEQIRKDEENEKANLEAEENAYVGDIIVLEADGRAQQADENDKLAKGFGLKKKPSKRSKLSKLDNLTLDDISKAVFATIEKKRSDKRRKGNNKYSGFQRRENGRFTGGIISDKNEIKQRIIDLVASNSINEGIRMLEVSKDIFTKNEYEDLAKIISRY